MTNLVSPETKETSGIDEKLRAKLMERGVRSFEFLKRVSPSRAALLAHAFNQRAIYDTSFTDLKGFTEQEVKQVIANTIISGVNISMDIRNMLLEAMETDALFYPAWTNILVGETLKFSPEHIAVEYCEYAQRRNASPMGNIGRRAYDQYLADIKSCYPDMDVEDVDIMNGSNKMNWGYPGLPYL